MHLHIGMNILGIMHEYVFVFVLVAVFTVTFCAHIISFDSNLIVFVLFNVLLPEKSRSRLEDLVCMDWHMVFALPLWTCILFFLCRFLCIHVNLVHCPCK